MNQMHRFLCKLLALTSLVVGSWNVAATPLDVSTPKYGIPPNIATTSNRPMMMLATSKDHTLFGPIYTDFEDIDDDGTIDTTFTPTFKYYGYFDPTKCYEYNNTSKRFNPMVLSTVVPTTVTVVVGTTTTSVSRNRYKCESNVSYWSGNFLNWASMTRIDVVRKMLYGGKRSSDTGTLTVLERAKLNYDAHSFAKYYNGTDIRDYTPFTTTALTKTTGTNPNVYAGLTVCNLGSEDSNSASNNPIMRMARGNFRLWSTVEHRVCQFRDLLSPPDTDSKFTNKLARYYKDADKGGGGIAHEAQVPHSTNDGATYGGIGPDLIIRVKVCDPALLGEERCQAFPPSSTTNYKPYGLLQEFGYSSSGGAARAEFGLITGSYDKNITAGALRKNMGDFADEINSTTGVFCHSPSSGCAATLADGRTTGAGAIKALDAFLLYGRDGGALNYPGSASMPVDLTDGVLPAWGNPMGEMIVQTLQYYAYNGSAPTPTNPSSTSNDTGVGMPVATWQDPLSNSNATRKANYGNSICRPMYALALSSSALSFDAQAGTPFTTLPNRAQGALDNYTNAIGTAENLNNSLRSVGSVDGSSTYGDSCSGKTISSLSSVSGICPEAPAMGGSYQVAGAALYGNTSKIRTIASPPSDLKFVRDALKVKTLAASLSGGAARIDVLIPNSNPKKYVYITPESLWNGGTRAMPGAMLTFASISSSATHGAFIVTWNDRLLGGDYDMDLTGFLRYDLIFNPARSGPDKWDIKITTDVPANCSGASGTHGFSVIGVTNGPGGTSANGRYLTHQHWGRNVISSLSSSAGYLCGNTAYRNATSANNTSVVTYNPTVNRDGACYINPIPVQSGSAGYCNVQDVDFPISHTFTMVGAEDALVKDPLWYAGKYGSFASSTKNADGTYTDVTMPPDVASWDKFLADGSPGSDGVPDGYFLARRPDLLEQQLRKALDDLAKNSNAAPAVSSSQLISEGFKYVAKFDSTTIEGNIEAYKVDNLGFFKNDAEWKAGQLLTTRTSGPAGDKGNGRNIVTNQGNASAAASSTTGGFPFRWASLPAAYKTQMTTASTNTLSTTNASLVVDYLRGDQSKEGAVGLRQRGDNILGPIVNATPWIQTNPTANFRDSLFGGYRDFAALNANRVKLLWVSANDGMLHAFRADSGDEVFAFVPGMLANRLAEIPLQRGNPGRTRLNNANFTSDAGETLPQGTVWPYVDGSPYTADVKIGNSTPPAAQDWRTYVFSTLGRGGKGIFALDATNVATLQAGESGSNPGAIFRWQFTSDDDADFGYLVNDISISGASRQPTAVVKLNNGKFALMLGNGQKSTNGKSALFLLFMEGPDPANASWTGRYVKIIADAGPNNGLSTPNWLDLDGNGTADIAYAGDLKGNLWRFDLRSSDPTQWKVAYTSGGNKPLYTAKDGTATLAITAAPEFASPGFEGIVVVFGTGNAFESGDFPRASVTQRVYGILDRPAFADGAANPRALPTGLSTLEQRTFTRQANGNVIITGNPADIDWASKDGWYINLPGTSEMILSDPEIRGTILAMTSVRPKEAVDDCSNTPNVTLYSFDPVTGTTPRIIQGTTTEGTNVYNIAGSAINDQKVRIVNDRTNRAFSTACRKGDPNCTCTTVGGVEKCERDTVQGRKTICAPDQTALRIIGQSTDVPWCDTPPGRVSWREIPGLRTDK